MSVLGLNSKDRKSTSDKANISNPKVNRGCAPLTANRISADCVQISLGPSMPYIPLGGLPYWGIQRYDAKNSQHNFWAWAPSRKLWFTSNWKADTSTFISCCEPKVCVYAGRWISDQHMVSVSSWRQLNCVCLLKLQAVRHLWGYPGARQHLHIHGPLTRYANGPGMPGTFSPPPRFSNPDMHHVRHVPLCMPGSLNSGFFRSRWREKRSWHSRRMRNPQFCVSGKRPMEGYHPDSACC